MNSSGANMTGLILAGRRPGADDPLDKLAGGHKALLEFGGRTMLQRVIETLAGCEKINEIIVAGDQSLKLHIESIVCQMPVRLVDAISTPASTISSIMEKMPASETLLVTTCDHPLLRRSMIDEFLAGLMIEDCSAGAACVLRADYVAAFSESRRTYIKLKGFEFSGANLFWFQAEKARELIAFWRNLEAMRKNPFRMAMTIGPLTGIKYLAGVLTKDQALATIKRRTGVQAALVALTDAEAAIDVDKPEDVELVRSLLRKRAMHSESVNN